MKRRNPRAEKAQALAIRLGLKRRVTVDSDGNLRLHMDNLTDEQTAVVLNRVAEVVSSARSVDGWELYTEIFAGTLSIHVQSTEASRTLIPTAATADILKN